MRRLCHNTLRTAAFCTHRNPLAATNELTLSRSVSVARKCSELRTTLSAWCAVIAVATERRETAAKITTIATLRAARNAAYVVATTAHAALRVAREAVYAIDIEGLTGVGIDAAYAVLADANAADDVANAAYARAAHRLYTAR